MKHLIWFVGIVAGLYLILMVVSGLSGQIDVISLGREIMTAGWSLAGSLGF